MFFSTQSNAQKKEYEDFLKIAGSLSNLFSESTTPYLYYRVAERVFCRAFGAEDLSRGDISADAKKGNLGIGLKTFGSKNGNEREKIAEFNKDRHIYGTMNPGEMIKTIAELRNERLTFTMRSYDIDSLIYHCVIRDEGKFVLYEENMDLIDIANIRNIEITNSSISFNDGINEYSFSISKSTLYKKFKRARNEYEFEVKMMDDPLMELKNLIESLKLGKGENEVVGTIFLPLYGFKKGEPFVFTKSGLNSWNASQEKRRRDPDEVYIRIPAEVHEKFPGFLPPKETHFDIRLPNGKIMKSKVCSDGGKQLMSYPNTALGKWILREVLELEEGELLTYQKLQKIGIDAIRLDKMSNGTFQINFSNSGSYDDFISQEDEEE